MDQHIGVWIKEQIKSDYFDMAEDFLDKIEDGRLPADARMKPKQVRAKIAEFAFKASELLSQKHHLVESSWINFGVSDQVPMDGSRDDDVSTLHKDGGYQRSRYEDIEDFEIIDEQEE